MNGPPLWNQADLPGQAGDPWVLLVTQGARQGNTAL